MDTHLFEHHELIQEVDTLTGEEFPDGFLSLKALRVRAGVYLGRLVPQELCQSEVLHTERRKDAQKKKNYQEGTKNKEMYSFIYR